jgi:hypothetical protein
MPSEYEVAWNLFTELRKEILESQRIRAQIIGLKITFVGTGIALIAANPEKIDGIFLVIPAFAAIFFDFLITSYSFSVKRIGNYSHNHLEKWIRTCPLAKDFVLWQQFLREKKTRQIFSHFGNIGLTTLALVPAVISIAASKQPWVAGSLLVALLASFAYDIIASCAPGRLEKARILVDP